MTDRHSVLTCLVLVACLTGCSGNDGIGTAQIIDGETRPQREVARAKTELLAMLTRAAATSATALATRTHCGSYPRSQCDRMQSYPRTRRRIAADIAVIAAAQALRLLPALHFAIFEEKPEGTDADGEPTRVVARKSPTEANQIDLWRPLAENAAVDERGHHDLVSTLAHEVGHFLDFTALADEVTDFGEVEELGMLGGDFLDYLVFLWSQSDADSSPHQTSLIADFNGDGRADYLVYNLAFLDTLGITAYVNRGSGLFGAGPPLTGFPSGAGSRLATGDFNGDGRADTLRYRLDAAGSHETQVLFSDGTDGFVPATPFRDGEPYAAGSELVTGDFNGDGRTDYMIYRFETTGQKSYVYLSDGYGGFAPRIASNGGYDYPPALFKLLTGDFNGDGRTDYMIYALEYGDQGETSVYLSDGRGGFLPRALFRCGFLFYHDYDLALGDYDGNGRTDFLVYSFGHWGSYETSVYLGDGTGTFQPRRLSAEPFAYPNGSRLVTGDFNGDGRTDTLIYALDRDGSHETNVYLSDGSGGFHPKETSRDGNAFPLDFQFRTGDFNGDGRTDYLVHDPSYLDSHETNLYLRAPSGGFSRRTPFDGGP